MKPKTATALDAIITATLPQGWENLGAVGEWRRTAILQKPGVVAGIQMRPRPRPAGTVEVSGSRRTGPGNASVSWTGHFSEIQAGIAWVTAALLVRA